jgi:tetratricopeptide (TPR) repeat protein
MKRMFGPQAPASIAVHANASRVLIAARRTEAALRMTDQWLSSVENRDQPLPYHVGLDAAHIARALALMNSGQLQRAQASLDRIDPALPRRRPGSMLDPEHAQGILDRLSGHYLLAEQRQRAALALMTDRNEGPRNRMHVLTEIGLSQLGQKQLDEAESSLHAALTLFEQRQVQVTPRRADALLAIGRILLARDQAADALPYLEAADQFWLTWESDSHWRGESAWWRSRALARLGRMPESRALSAVAESLLNASNFASDQVLVDGAE